ncbi:MAG: hypothetical protein IT320_05465 [Anaerolineae bacterium]|nr:hypothetical protein [Anaerolineae bacterium]
MVDFVISLTEEQRKRAEARARALGYANPDEYLHALVEHALEEDDDAEEVLASLDRSLAQMARGAVMTVDEMWRRLESGDDDDA